MSAFPASTAAWSGVPPQGMIPTDPTMGEVREIVRENGRLESGVETFDVKRGESAGMRYVKFNRWLEGLIAPESCSFLARVGLVVYEQPFVMRSGPAAEIALGLTEHAVVLERGSIVHRARSRELLANAALLDRYIGLKLPEAAGA